MFHPKMKNADLFAMLAQATEVNTSYTALLVLTWETVRPDPDTRERDRRTHRDTRQRSLSDGGEGEQESFVEAQV